MTQAAQNPVPALSEADQAYYDQLDEDVTAGRVGRIGTAVHRDGSRISDDELDAILTGRPSLGATHATGRGRSPRRQVRLSQQTDAALENYVTAHDTTASAVIRKAVETFLATA